MFVSSANGRCNGPEPVVVIHSQIAIGRPKAFMPRLGACCLELSKHAAKPCRFGWTDDVAAWTGQPEAIPDTLLQSIV